MTRDTFVDIVESVGGIVDCTLAELPGGSKRRWPLVTVTLHNRTLRVQRPTFRDAFKIAVPWVEARAD